MEKLTDNELLFQLMFTRNILNNAFCDPDRYETVICFFGEIELTLMEEIVNRSIARGCI